MSYLLTVTPYGNYKPFISQLDFFTFYRGNEERNLCSSQKCLIETRDGRDS